MKNIPEIIFKSESVVVRLLKRDKEMHVIGVDSEKTFSIDDLSAKKMSILVTIYLANTTKVNETVEKIIKENVFSVPAGYENLYEIVYNKISNGVVLSAKKFIADAIAIAKVFNN